jgi:hypothetical protein
VGGSNRRQIDRYIDRVNPDVVNRPWEYSSPEDDLPIFSVTKKSWSGTDYACYLCPRSFDHLNQLEQHINSPKHTIRDQKLYACPLPSCIRQFQTLSGLVQHAEMSGCPIGRVRDIRWDGDVPLIQR